MTFEIPSDKFFKKKYYDTWYREKFRSVHIITPKTKTCKHQHGNINMDHLLQISQIHGSVFQNNSFTFLNFYY
jgi:hypothetical protein